MLGVVNYVVEMGDIFAILLNLNCLIYQVSFEAPLFCGFIRRERKPEGLFALIIPLLMP